jgi:Ca-activated chloride channel homolog
MNYLIPIVFTLFTFFGFAQVRNVKTKIESKNIFELSIIQVYPDSFPNVSVVFQAKNQYGKPLWLLKKTELEITENGIPSKILRLINISKNKPLNIGLVFDHSGSMFENPEIDFEKMMELSERYYMGESIPSDYVSSLDYAKEGVIQFLTSPGNHEDSILFVGFSEVVDKVFPLSNNLDQIRSFMEGIEPTGATAFYDAIYTTIDSLVLHSSNSAIIAMTDGMDNSSTHSYEEVIAHAKKNNIPIYVIGLGGVDKRSLKKMARKTDGFFYQTNDPNKLKEIYASIKGQLKSIYQVDYTSACMDFDTDERMIQFSFENDIMTFTNNSEKYNLPKEVQEYLKTQEKVRLENLEKEKQNLYWMIGGALGITLLGFSGFLIYRKRKSDEIILENISPNPFESEVIINFTLPSKVENSQLMIYHISGQLMNTFEINQNSNELKIDLSHLSRGVYIFKITSGQNTSNKLKAVRN